MQTLLRREALTEGVTITIKSDKSWTKENGSWPDTSSGKYGEYEKSV